MRPRAIAITVRAVLTVALAAGGVIAFRLLLATGPVPQERPSTPVIPTVEVATLQPESYRVQIPSQGIIEPRTRSVLTAEVAGKVIEVSPNLLAGAAFTEGEILVQLDDRDYRTALQRAEAAVVRAETALQLAEAQTERARADWQRLGNGHEPGDLTLRLPQLNEARADLLSAQADLEEARYNVARCQIRAPYGGRVISKAADVGQFVSPGSQLAELFASGSYEVRLPVRQGQLAFLPPLEPGSPGPEVRLFGEGGANQEWAGRIDRVDAEVDARSRQVFLIARIDSAALRNSLLPVGTFVEAQIEGVTLEDVFLIPRRAIRGRSTVLGVSPQNRLKLIETELLYGGDPEVLVVSPSPSFKSGDRISLTPLPFAGTGDPVEIQGEAPPRPLAEGLNPRRPQT